MEFRSHKDLLVWGKAVVFCTEIYRITEKFPTREIYGLSSQMRRAAVSISSNIAEGRSRGTRKDFIHFLVIARGSCAELATQITIARNLSFLTEEKFETCTAQLEEIGKMLSGMIKKLAANP